MPEPAVAAATLMPVLRLAVDARDLVRDERGIGTYARALLARYVGRDDVELTLLTREWFPGRARAAFAAVLGTAPRRIRFASHVPRDAGVVWSPWNGTFFSGAAPAVATLHDLIPFALPDADATRRESQQAPFLRTAASAAAIVCDSAFTAADAVRYLGVETSRLTTIPLGVDPAFSPGPSGALPATLRGRRYVLYVGAHDAHKNVDTLAAGHRLAFPGGDVALVFTRPNPRVTDAVVCERVATATLVALYRGATIVAVPSLYEGFGLPVLEAMACGAPVLAARATALPEAGGDAAVYVDEPREAVAWGRALRALAADGASRAQCARAGPARAAGFSWDRCAQRTLAILRGAARGSATAT